MATYTTDSNTSYASSGVGTAGLTLGVIGTALASGLLGGNGIGGLFGNSSAQQQLSSLQMENSILKANAATDTKLVDVYTELRARDKEQDATIASIDKRLAAVETAAPLREQIVMDQITSVANASTAAINALSASTNASVMSLQNSIAALQALTKTVIPITNVCPQPMPQYNSWTAPTTTTTTATTGA